MQAVTKLFLIVIIAGGLCATAEARQARTVKVASVHFGPKVGDVDGNLKRLVALTEEASRAGARIVVHTELATAGYSYFSREQIRAVAEPIPGRTTRSLGRVARMHGLFIAVGLPEIDPATNRFYNSAVLIGPTGAVVGKYRKRSHLLESSWASIGEGLIPTFNTPYGRLAIVICADLFYPELARLAALSGVDILLAPSNVGIDENLLKVRTFEDGFSIVMANRHGTEEAGRTLDVFTQETFRIISPFPYKFDYESNRSIIITAGGQILANVNSQRDQIAYGELPVRPVRRYPVERRPQLYSLLGQDTLEPYTFTQLGLPRAGAVTVASIDPGADLGRASMTEAVNAFRRLATQAKEQAGAQGQVLRLIVLPANSFAVNETTFDAEPLKTLASELGLDLVVGVTETSGGKTYASSLLFTKERQLIKYRRVHRLPGERLDLGDAFVVADRDYARIALLQGADIFAPETSRVLAKMGADIIVVSADDASPLIGDLCRIRTGDYVHIMIANRHGLEGVYAGGYVASPDHVEGEGVSLMTLDTGHVRNKKEMRRFDGWDILLQSSPRPATRR
jgi:predicted amidohydrolase